jgi:hypothetical protein
MIFTRGTIAVFRSNRWLDSLPKHVAAKNVKTSIKNQLKFKRNVFCIFIVRPVSSVP